MNKIFVIFNQQHKKFDQNIAFFTKILEKVDQNLRDVDKNIILKKITGKSDQNLQKFDKNKIFRAKTGGLWHNTPPNRFNRSKIIQANSAIMMAMVGWGYKYFNRHKP